MNPETCEQNLFDAPRTEAGARPLGEPVARDSDPWTSHEAGERFYRSGKLRGQMKLVYLGVQRWPGRTSAELGRLIGIDRHAAARRLPGLERKRFVRKGPARFCTVCRSACVTWYSIESKTPLLDRGPKHD
jgi:hypothetical protein